MTAIAPTIFGKYQLVERLARGGMAEVFKAKSHGVEGFEKTLVIKRILPELSSNPQFVEMFINEAKIAVTLSHANVVQVFDLGRAEDSYFIAMEFVAGYDLATLIRRAKVQRQTIKPELAVFVVSELAKALDYAHRRRDAHLRPLHIVHRDVSPQNVLVSFEGEVKLTDFGVAKARTFMAQATEAGVLKGKYAYMSPEQSRGEPVDARTDLYALGVVLFELLSGTNPFEGDSTYETLRRVREGDRASLQQLAPEVSDELAQIVERSIHPSADERYQNAGALYEELVQFLYTSGRRVGGHDLSRYVQLLREAASSSQSDRARDGDAFKVLSDNYREPTPVQMLSKLSRKGSSVARPTRERRDVSVLCMLGENAAGALAAPEALTIAHRLGGVPLPSDDPDEALFIFGLRDPDGRDTEAAARCALRALHWGQSNPTRVRFTGAAGVDCARILVDQRGDAVLDDSFTEVVMGARTGAAAAGLHQVLVTSAAQRAIQTLFETLPLSDDDGALHQVERELSPLDSAGKFVGRRDELKRIGEAFAVANRGNLRVLGVQGEAGAGKTRLLHEAKRRLRSAGHDVGMYVATCHRQSRSIGLSAIQDLLRAILGVDDLDAPEVIRDKVMRTRELGLTPPEVGAIGVLLGATPAAEASESLGRLVRPAIIRVTLKLASDRLTALCFDGAEAMDDDSQSILDALIREAKDARLVVVLAHRPGFMHAWRDPSRFHEVVLQPFSDDDVARLVATRLAAEEVPAELLREVTLKSSGNPLYVEEYLKALADSGALEVREGRVRLHMHIAQTEVPKSLRGLVSSRLARLSATDRHFLQIGAVAGGKFAPELLVQVSGESPGAVLEACATLEGKGLLARVGSELVVANELVIEVLREGLTLESRRDLHGAIAAALEALYAQRLDEVADRLATHYRESGDRGRALEYLIRAADRGASEQPRTALHHLQRAIDLASTAAQRDATRLLDLYIRYGTICLAARFLQEGAQKLIPAIELAESLSRDEALATLCLLRGRMLVQAYEIDEAMQWLDRAEHTARQIQDVTLERDATIARAEASSRRGERLLAITGFERALELCEATGDRDRQLRCLIHLALTHGTGGEQARGLERVQSARELLGRRPDRAIECELLTAESVVQFYAKNYTAALESSTRALELSKEFELPYYAAVSAHNIGETHVRLGDFKRAFSSLRYSYEVARDNAIEHVQYANLRVLGFIDALNFGSPDGRHRIVEATEFAERKHAIWEWVQGRLMLAIVDQAQGNVEAARQGLRDALRVAVDHGYGTYAEQLTSALQALDRNERIELTS